MSRFLPALSLVLLAACAPDVGEGHVTATVSPVVSTATAATTQRVDIDTQASTLHAKAAKLTATHDIVFKDWSGSFELAEGQLQGVQVEVRIAGLEADHPKLTGHLHSPDFFDVERFPTASFRSTAVQAKAGPEGATHLVTGTMSMHGVDKELSFPARVEGASLKTEFVLDRQDFGIAYPGMPDDLIQDDVLLTIELKG